MNIRYCLLVGVMALIPTFAVGMPSGAPNDNAIDGQGHPACAACHEERGIKEFAITPDHIMVPFCAKCHTPSNDRTPDHPPLVCKPPMQCADGLPPVEDSEPFVPPRTPPPAPAFPGNGDNSDIPPEIMEQLNKMIRNGQQAYDTAQNPPDFTHFSPPVQKACKACHDDTQSMSKVSDGMFSAEEQFMHTLFARNVMFFKPMGVKVVMIVPTDGVDIIKHPNEICLLWQTSYPTVVIQYVYYQNAAGVNTQHVCTQIRKVNYIKEW